MKPPHRNKRLAYLLASSIAVTLGAVLIFSALGQNVSYFYSPLQIQNGEADGQKRIRLGGLVAEGSVKRGKGTETIFEITDGAATTHVRYTGILPDLFREGQGVIAQGEFDQGNLFLADIILAKHDENYVPKELKEALNTAQKQTASPVTKSNYNYPIPSGQVAHSKKNYIRKNCAKTVISSKHSPSGAAFLKSKTDPEAIFLALAHGTNGVSLYTAKGERVFHINEAADTISAFNDVLLIYRGIEETSELLRYEVDSQGELKLLTHERPSEISPTTLQRNSYAALGAVAFKDDGVLFEKSFLKLEDRPTALAASAEPFGDLTQNGTVAIGLASGDIQLWEFSEITAGCIGQK